MVVMSDYHVPVLLHRAVNELITDREGVYVDVTFGGGGHSREILKGLGQRAELVGFDQDLEAAANVPDDNRFVFVQSNFRWVGNWLDYLGFAQVDGVLADLGVSSHQFDQLERGFSFRGEAPIDMRMGSVQEKTAMNILHQYEHGQLAKVFREYGEVKNAGALASAVIRERELGQLNTTVDLGKLAERFRGKQPLKKYLAMVFQALRIEVNDEMGALQQLLSQMESRIKPGGRLVVIAYHSLEDRLVKNYLRGKTVGEEDVVTGRVKRAFVEVTKKPVLADEAEQVANPRSRSAKMRIAERTDE